MEGRGFLGAGRNICPPNHKHRKTKDMKTLEKKTRITARRAAHHAALETLRAPGCKTSGALIWKRLRRIEARAHDAATAQLNGEAYGTQPFRPDWHEDGTEGTAARPTPWEAYETAIRAEVAAVFGGILPQGFFLNQDCRGYALKLRPEKCTVPPGMSTDWGRNGILAAEIDDI
jgi:hypothetical protein